MLSHRLDWNKVPVDTPILVKNLNGDEWKHRYFAEYVCGRVYAWKDGNVSWSSNGHKDGWSFAELAESEGNNGE